MKKYNKKGIMLGEGVPAVTALVLIAIIVIVAIFIFATLTTNLPTTTVRTINETGWMNQSGYLLKNATSCNAKSPTIIYVINASNDAAVPSTNYTTVVESGVWTFRNATGAELAGGVKITYDWLSGGEACKASTTMGIQFGTYPVLIGLVGTIIFLALIIGVLIGTFAGSPKGA